jgi:hypothetical protein
VSRSVLDSITAPDRLRAAKSVGVSSPGTAGVMTCVMVHREVFDGSGSVSVDCIDHTQTWNF